MKLSLLMFAAFVLNGCAQSSGSPKGIECPEEILCATSNCSGWPCAHEDKVLVSRHSRVAMGRTIREGDTLLRSRASHISSVVQ